LNLNDAFITNEFENIHNAIPDEDGLIVCAVIPLANMIIYPNVITPVMLPHNLSKNGDRSESEAMKAVRAAMAANQTAIIVMRKGANDEAEGTADKDAAGEDTKAEASDSKNSALIGLNAADALAADAL